MPTLPDCPPDQPVLIAGPTASGKSALALEIARRDGGVIINADALQVYACWRILSARPSPQEEAAVPHALFGHVPCGPPYSVGHWLRDVTAKLSAGGARPIFVGGTGLYFSALTEGLSPVPEIPAEVRARGDALRRADPAAMVAELSAEDAETAAQTDLQNPMRVQRAWEVLRATGTGLKAWQRRASTPLLPLPEVCALVIEADRDWLVGRIETRFDAMLEAGALQEVEAVLDRWDPGAPWARAIGAPELVAYLHGESTLEEARTATILATRQYAKRQRTWFRKRMRDWQPWPVE